MRCIARRLVLLSAALLIASLPVLADETTGKQLMGPSDQEQKDECLLVANNCDRTTTFEGKIDSIRREINKGSAVYNDDELKNLNKKLNDTIKEMNDIYNKGGA